MERHRTTVASGAAERILLLAIGLLLISAIHGNASELRQTPIVRAIQSATPSIVNIRGEKTISDSGQYTGSDPVRHVNGMGTGVVIDQRGYIVTNHHVVQGVRQILVTTFEGQEYTARLIARDPITDLAIIKIDTQEEIPSITLGSSDDLMLGETVIAVGNAYGYENSCTQGIVSSLHRAVQVSDAQYYDDLIQTDASINPGNSGGPLLNIDGEMIGLNVAVRAGAQGIGFAIPVDKVLAVVSELIAEETGNSRRHGIRLTGGAATNSGSLIIEAIDPGSPAEKAGLQAGDRIVSVDGHHVERSLGFYRAMLDRSGGEMVQLTVERAGQSMDLELALSDAPASSQDWADLAWDTLGVELEPIPGEQFRRNYRTRYRGGMTITKVRPGSPAADQGIMAGDVLVGMHIWETLTIKNVAYVMNRPDLEEFSPIKIYLLRDNDVLYGHLPVSMNTTVRR